MDVFWLKRLPNFDKNIGEKANIFGVLVNDIMKSMYSQQCWDFITIIHFHYKKVGYSISRGWDTLPWVVDRNKSWPWFLFADDLEIEKFGKDFPRESLFPP